MKFRFDIGFLRALAVIVVLLFHYKVPFFYGGFIGVDIFFVISGYLMTSIILSGFAKNNFSVAKFYKRRVNRILPALLFMLLGTLSFAFFYYLPFDYMQISRYAASASIFVSNIYFALKSGYFDPASQFNPYLHTWSLSVEWQFYIFYPLILLVLKRTYLNKRKLFTYLFSGMTIFSFISIIIMNEFLANKGYIFYLVFPRAWEMMIGGFAYLFADRFNYLLDSTNRKWIVLSSLGILGLCTFFYRENFSWPSYLTIVPVVATAAIIISDVDFRFFKNGILQFVGKISYSLYLWHWPLYVFLLYRNYNVSTPMVAVSLLVLSVLLAYISYFLVEEWAKNVRSTQIVVAVLLVFVAVMINTWKPINYRYFPERISQIQFKADSIKRHSPNYGWNIQPKNNFEDFKKYLAVDTTKTNVLIIGDSHAGHFSTALLELVDTTRCNLLFQMRSGTLPIKDIDDTAFGKSRDILAKKMMNYVFEEFAPNNKEHLDLIVISANFFAFIKSGDRQLSELLAIIKKTTDYISSLGIPFIILGQTEVYEIPYPLVASLQQLSNRVDYTNSHVFSLNQALKNMYPKNQYIDIYNYESNKTPQHLILDSIYMYDGHHFSYHGAEQIIKRMIMEGRIDFHDDSR